MDNEYIWHCPGKNCYDRGTIILKTRNPFLGSGKVRCSLCQKTFNFSTIVKANTRNIHKYLDDIENEVLNEEI